jgi:XTP/dITP diphosphohydrolase
MILWIATSNKGKLKEFQRLIDVPEVELKSLEDLEFYASPEETGKTFEENAKIKAKSLGALKNEDWILAEDSGLMVNGLKGSPGVYSARYAGDDPTDAENNQKVLHMMSIRSPVEREAAFISVIAIRSPDKQEFIFEGRTEGTIATGMRGSEGFGYDSIFIPQGEEKTFAELGLEFKNKCSHRYKAIKLALGDMKTKWA